MSSLADPAPSNRYASLDVLKAFGIATVLVIHQVFWILVDEQGCRLRFPETAGLLCTFYRSGIHFIGAAPGIIAGTSVYFMAANGRQPGGRFLKRILLLILLGYGTNFLTWGYRYWPNTFDWDFLQFIGLGSLILFAVIRALPRVWPLAVSALSGAAVLFDTSFPLPESLHDAYWYLILFGDPGGKSYWPLCPLFAFLGLGALMGGTLQSGSARGRLLIGLTGLAMVFPSAFARKLLPACNAQDLFGVAMFKPERLFVVGTVGAVFVLTGVLEILDQRTGWPSCWCRSRWIDYLSRGILWIYLVDLVVVAHLTRFLAQRVHTPATAAALLVVMLPVCFAIAYGIGALRVRYSSRKQET